jgi:hypothetical protein
LILADAGAQFDHSENASLVINSAAAVGFGNSAAAVGFGATPAEPLNLRIPICRVFFSENGISRFDDENSKNGQASIQNNPAVKATCRTNDRLR